MKFNVELPDDAKEYLTRQYKEYLKKTPMNSKEQRALRNWVRNGNSVYDNPWGAWQDGMVPVEFLDVYRDEEEICQQTAGMSPEEARKAALAYYGWSDDSETWTPETIQDALSKIDYYGELPFN